jgi:hypothetical protein
MKQEDIVALARAGFTREQIVALAGLQQTAPIQQTVPVQQTAPIQQTVPVQQTAQVQQTAPVQQTVPVQQSESSGDPVLDALMGLREDMKKQALLFSSQPSAQRETADDILASIINPKGEKINGE